MIEQYGAGAQAFSSFDTLLAPFVRSDGLDYAAVKQCLQEFVFNVNVPTRVGFQTPFSNLTLDVTPPPPLTMPIKPRSSAENSCRTATAPCKRRWT